MVKITRRPRMGISPKIALSVIGTSMREEFLKRCGEEFDREVAKQEAMIREMDLHYKFKYGQVVKRHSTSTMDTLLGVPAVEYGVVVGHSDFEKPDGSGRHYLVHTENGHPFLGCQEDSLEAVTSEDEIPEKLRVMDIRIQGRIGGKKLAAIHVYDSHI